MSRWSFALAALALSACAPEPAPLAPDADARRIAGLALAATGALPGELVTLTVTGAAPGERVWFWSSPGGEDQGPCPAFLGGVCLSLGAPANRLGSAVADPDGVATKVTRVSAALPLGSTLTWQAGARRGVAGNASVVSNAWTATLSLPPWSNEVAVDGDLSEWTDGESFVTSSASTAGVTWDADSLYVAVSHPDVETGGSEHWAIVALATGGPGSATGATLGTQTPGLPFEADLILRRKMDGSYDDLLTWNPQLQGWDLVVGELGAGVGFAAAESGAVLELALPRDRFVSDQVGVVVALAFEGQGFESTYAGVPATAFADGYDPDWTDFLDLDLGSPDPAAVQAAP